MAKKENKKEIKKVKKSREIGSKLKEGFEEALKEINSFFNKSNTTKYKTTQDTLSFDFIKDGIIKISKNRYSKILEFFDRNYELSSSDEKEDIFLKLSKIINSFDDSINLQLFYLNENEKSKFEKKFEDFRRINLNKTKEGFDEIYNEYTDIIKEKAVLSFKTRKRKFLIFSVQEESEKDAINRLKLLSQDIKKDFENMGVKAYSLDTLETLELIYGILNKGKNNFFTEKEIKDIEKVENLNFNEKNIKFKNLIAPKEIEIDENFLKINDFYCSTEYIDIVGKELSDNVLQEFLDLDENINLSFHITALDRVKSLRKVRRTLTDLQAMKVTAQQKALKSGYDMDIISSTLKDNIENVENLLLSLKGNSEKLYSATILISYFGKKKSKLKAIKDRLLKIASKNELTLNVLPFLQEQGFLGNLPICKNEIEYDRFLTTSGLSVFIPFKTFEFFEKEKAIYYGVNDLSKNLIMLDRNKLSTPNGLIFGIPGKGKSFIAKKEILNVFFNTEDEILICDPEAEYVDLTKTLGGEVIKLSTNSKNFLNPLDINLNYGDDKNPIKSKINFILSFFELIRGDDLSASEKTVIDRCLPKIYKEYFENPIPQNMPVLQDLYEALKLEGRVGRELSVELEIYVTGSLNVFNNRSNVDINKKFICFDIKELDNQIKKIGMLKYF